MNYKSNDLHIYFIELIVDINLELLLFKKYHNFIFFLKYNFLKKDNLSYILENNLLHPQVNLLWVALLH